MAWTFGGVTFQWVAPDVNGLPAAPTWQRAPRLVERPLLGSGDADIVRVGYEPWRVSGTILVSAANAGQLQALSGTSATLSDGTTSWPAVGSIVLTTLFVSTEGATGTATFTRPAAT